MWWIAGFAWVTLAPIVPEVLGEPIPHFLFFRTTEVTASKISVLTVFFLLVFSPAIQWLIGPTVQRRLAQRRHQKALEAVQRLEEATLKAWTRMESEMISKQAAQAVRRRMQLLGDIPPAPKPPKNKGGRPRKQFSFPENFPKPTHPTVN